VINSLATASWLEEDRNLPIETHNFWTLGQKKK